MKSTPQCCPPAAAAGIPRDEGLANEQLARLARALEEVRSSEARLPELPPYEPLGELPPA